MKYPLKVITEPANDPVTVAEAKAFFREDRSVEDTLIEGFITAARKALETHTGYVMVDTTFEMRLQDFEDVKIPKRPFQSLTKIEYVDDAGTTQTLGSDKYNLHSHDRPVEIEFLDNLPDLDDEEDTKYPVIITFVAGYGAQADVPEDWKMATRLVAMLMWLRDTEGSKVHPITNGVVQTYLQDYKIGRFK